MKAELRAAKDMSEMLHWEADDQGAVCAVALSFGGHALLSRLSVSGSRAVVSTRFCFGSHLPKPSTGRDAMGCI